MVTILYLIQLSSATVRFIVRISTRISMEILPLCWNYLIADNSAITLLCHCFKKGQHIAATQIGHREVKFLL